MRCHLSKYFAFSSFMLLLLCLGLISPVTSQELTLEKTWGGTDDDEGNGVACDSSGNIYVTGDTDSFGADAEDAFLLRYDSSGNLNWQRTWGGAGDDVGNSVTIDSSGNIYVTGDTDSLGASSNDVFLLRYDSSGNLNWQRTWGGANSDNGESVAVDSSGNIYVTGWTRSFGAADQDVFLLSYDSSGNLNWQRTWDGIGDDAGFGVVVGSSGKIYVTGRTEFGAGDDDVFLLCYGSSGNLNWQRTWGGIGSDEGIGVAVDSSGNIYVAGDTLSFSGSRDAFLLRYDSLGNLNWQRIWGGTGRDEGNGVAVDSSNNIYVTGDTESFGDGKNDVFLLCYDSSGRLRFQKTWGGTDFDQPNAVTICGDRLCITGLTTTASHTLSDVSGTITTPTGTEGSPTGTEKTPLGTETTPTGTETTPTGSETFAGNSESILLCFSLEQPPVGGTIMPINKLAIFGPYLALAGIVTLVLTGLAIKRKRE